MEKHLHWDGAAGAAGDMLLASLIDAGADSAAIREALERLPLGPWRMTASEVLRGGIAATHVDVVDLSDEDGGEADGDGDAPEPEVQPPPHHVHTHDAGQPSHFGHAVHTHDHPHRHGSALEMHRLEHGHAHEDDHGHEHHEHDHGHGHDHPHDHPHHHDPAHDSGGPHRHLADLLALAAHPSIPERARKRAERVFRALAAAEARVHGVTPEQVHFHEVSGLDTAVDVLGVCLALEDLDIDTVSAAPPFVGSGTLRIAHGVLPVPAPATLELLRSGNRPWIGEGRGELLTPTGAALLVTLTDAFSPPPRGFRVEHIGYGAGTRDSADRPNVVRAQVGALDRSVAAAPGAGDVTGEGRDAVVTYTCVLDDLAPEAAGYLAEHLFEAGAAEVYWVPAVMKKSRPGFELTVLAAPDRAEAVEEVLWRESSTFGFRRRVDARRVLARQFRTVNVSGQAIRVKLGFLEGRAIRRQPEYEDCRVAARALRRPLVDVMREAMTEAANLQETR